MIRRIAAMLLMTGAAMATTYYVDPAGSNANDGLSPQTAWRTLLKVGISTFQPGDQILFKRDAVWNEWLTPLSSGTAGNPIKFDAYGNGRPPEFTGRYQTKGFGLDEYFGECMASDAECDAGDLTIEVRAVRNDLGQCTDCAESSCS